MLKSCCFYFYLLSLSLTLLLLVFARSENNENIYPPRRKIICFWVFAFLWKSELLVLNNYKFYLFFTGAWIGFNKKSVNESKKSEKKNLVCAIGWNHRQFCSQTSNRTNSENIKFWKLFLPRHLLSLCFSLPHLQAPKTIRWKTIAGSGEFIWNHKKHFLVLFRKKIAEIVKICRNNNFFLEAKMMEHF